MTCLAWDGSTLAADRGVSRAELVTSYKKLHIVNGHRGRLMLGLCGLTALTDRIIDYFNSASSCDFPTASNYDKEVNISRTCGLVVTEQGVCHFLYADGTFSGPMLDKWGTDGSGCVFLAGALAAGASAVHAIELAIQHTNCAFLGVDYISFEEFVNGKI